MSPWLACALIAVVLAAAIGIVPLRRYQDRRWAEHLARQRFQTTPEFAQLAASFEQFSRAVGEALMPAMQRAVVAVGEFAKAFGEVYDSLPWWRRLEWRIRGRILRWRR